MNNGTNLLLAIFMGIVLFFARLAYGGPRWRWFLTAVLVTAQWPIVLVIMSYHIPPKSFLIIGAAQFIVAPLMRSLSATANGRAIGWMCAAQAFASVLASLSVLTPEVYAATLSVLNVAQFMSALRALYTSK